MTPLVVDTNVAIVANGDEENSSFDQSCRSACVRKLREVMKSGVIVIDKKGEIISEYRKRLKYDRRSRRRREVSVGDVFFRHLWDHLYEPSRVRRVSITPSRDDRRSFEELPRNKLDPSDRKFLAVAVVAKGSIVNATDSDWSEQAALTERLGVKVIQLCPQHASKKAK